MIQIKCYGHKCRDKDNCPLYSATHVEGDENEGDNDKECDIIQIYARQITQHSDRKEP